jgi:hypothetical protein
MATRNHIHPAAQRDDAASVFYILGLVAEGLEPDEITRFSAERLLKGRDEVTRMILFHVAFGKKITEAMRERAIELVA